MNHTKLESSYFHSCLYLSANTYSIYLRGSQYFDSSSLIRPRFVWVIMLIVIGICEAKTACFAVTLDLVILAQLPNHNENIEVLLHRALIMT